MRDWMLRGRSFVEGNNGLVVGVLFGDGFRRQGRDEGLTDGSEWFDLRWRKAVAVTARSSSPSQQGMALSSFHCFFNRRWWRWVDLFSWLSLWLSLFMFNYLKKPGTTYRYCSWIGLVSSDNGAAKSAFGLLEVIHDVIPGHSTTLQLLYYISNCFD